MDCVLMGGGSLRPSLEGPDIEIQHSMDDNRG